MDIDRFVADNRSTWDRLGELTGRINKLSGEEVRELTRLYQRTSGHLAYAQAHFTDPTLKAFLTKRVAQSAGALYGAHRRGWRTFFRFFSETFPLAVWDLRWFVLASALIFLLPALVVGTWIAHSPAAFNITRPGRSARGLRAPRFRRLLLVATLGRLCERGLLEQRLGHV